MDRRFSNATSNLASAALKFCTELANYWRTVLADQGSPYRPELHYMRGPGPKVARGPRPSTRYAIRELVSRYPDSGLAPASAGPS
jgi:hypothetical protein